MKGKINNKKKCSRLEGVKFNKKKCRLKKIAKKNKQKTSKKKMSTCIPLCGESRFLFLFPSSSTVCCHWLMLATGQY